MLAGATGFSFKAIFIKAAYAYGVDATTLLALRMLFSLPVFLVMAVVSRNAGEPFTRRDWIAVVALGFTGYYLSSYLDFLGLLFITAGLERLILFLTPTIVVLMSALLFKTPIRRHHVISLALSYGGMALVFLSTLRLAQKPGDILLGGGLVLLSALTYSTYLIGMIDLRAEKAACEWVRLVPLEGNRPTTCIVNGHAHRASVRAIVRANRLNGA